MSMSLTGSTDKLFHECNLEFHELLKCSIYVYMWKGHPWANRKEIELEELNEYPCLSFEQGRTIPFILQKKC